MSKREDIKKILIIGSGPIVIGQAAEFDYAGTQACLALKEEGYEVVLCNSNPATIMTDPETADAGLFHDRKHVFLHEWFKTYLRIDRQHFQHPCYASGSYSGGFILSG